MEPSSRLTNLALSWMCSTNCLPYMYVLRTGEYRVQPGGNVRQGPLGEGGHLRHITLWIHH
jgi:hypothetical protein